MRKELSHLTMSARSRTAAGSQGARVVKSGTGSLVRETAYTVALALLSLSFVPGVRAVGHVFCADDMLFFCRSQMCLICYMLSCDSPHFWLHFPPTTGSRQAPNHDRTASVGLYSQDTRVVLVSFVDYPSQVNIRATTAPRPAPRRGAAAPSSHTAPL